MAPETRLPGVATRQALPVKLAGCVQPPTEFPSNERTRRLILEAIEVLDLLLLLAATGYLLVALAFAAVLDDDLPNQTVSGRTRELFAALLWPLFHLQWRHAGRHAQARHGAEFDWVRFSVPTIAA